MSTLTDFLLARITEDEEWARDSASPLYADAEEGTPAWSGRILADCTAKRRIVTEHEIRADRCRVCTAEAYGEWRRFRAPCPTLLALVEVYADHPDYQEKWRA